MSNAKSIARQPVMAGDAATTSRRTFFARAAAVAVAGGALGLAMPLPGQSAASPDIRVPIEKPLSLDDARPELRDAWRTLEHAYGELKATYAVYKQAREEVRQWEQTDSPPRSYSGRAYRKWEHRYDEFIDQVGLNAKANTWVDALADYAKAQMGIAHIRALDFDELALKSAAAVAFEGAFMELEEGGERRHLKTEKQIVAWSVAFDALLLSQEGRL